MDLWKTPSVPEIIDVANERGLDLDIFVTSFYLGNFWESLLTTGSGKMAPWRKALFSFLSRNAWNVSTFFGIPPAVRQSWAARWKFRTVMKKGFSPWKDVFLSLSRQILPFLKSPQFLLIGGFAGVILAGGVLLWLPWSHQPGQLSFLNALFTSASAVCVTGLVVVDTGTVYTTFGQVVIMLLIQAGGLGVMTFAALTFQMLGRRLSLQSQMVLHDSFFQQDIGADFRHQFFRDYSPPPSLRQWGWR